MISTTPATGRRPRLPDGLLRYPATRAPGRDAWIGRCLEAWNGRCVRLDDVALSLTPVYDEHWDLMEMLRRLTTLSPAAPPLAVLLGCDDEVLVSFVSIHDDADALKRAVERGTAVLTARHPGGRLRKADTPQEVTNLTWPSEERMSRLYTRAEGQAAANPSLQDLNRRVHEAGDAMAEAANVSEPEFQRRRADVSALIDERDHLRTALAARARTDLQKIGRRLRDL